MRFGVGCCSQGGRVICRHMARVSPHEARLGHKWWTVLPHDVRKGGLPSTACPPRRVSAEGGKPRGCSALTEGEASRAKGTLRSKCSKATLECKCCGVSGEGSLWLLDRTTRQHRGSNGSLRTSSSRGPRSIALVPSGSSDVASPLPVARILLCLIVSGSLGACQMCSSSSTS